MKKSVALRLAPVVLASAVLGCVAEVEPPVDDTEAAAHRGDAVMVEIIARVAREERVPRDLLLALALSESHLYKRDSALPPGAHDGEIEDDRDAHADGDGARCGYFGLDEGAAVEEAAALVGATPAELCELPELEARAAARRLRAIAGGEEAPLLADLAAWLPALDAWHPALEGQFPYADYVGAILRRGWEGVDELGASILLPPRDDVAPDLHPDPEVNGAALYARPDTSLARWAGPACDYTNASRTRGDVRWVIIHTCEGGFAGCVSTLKTCGGSQVSAHYVVSYSGYAVQLVEEQDVGWHVGCLNSRSIGIEHEGYAGSTRHPDEQMCKTAGIVRGICSRWGIACDRSHVIGHVEANRLYCGGSHWDPGPHWNWTRFMRMVNQRCTCPTSRETCDGRDNNCDGRVDEGVTNACGECGPVPAETCNGRDDDCDGTVDENVCDHAAASGDALPAAIELGDSVTRTLTFTNDGHTTWEPGTHAFVATGEGAEVSVRGEIGATVAIEGSVTAEVTVRPTQEGPISVSVSVAKDGRAFESAWTATAEAQRPAFAAAFVDLSAPASLASGDEAPGFVVLRNEGTEAWPAGTRVVARDVTSSALRVEGGTTGAVAPGESTRVALTFAAEGVRDKTTAHAKLVLRHPGGTDARWPDRSEVVAIQMHPAVTPATVVESAVMRVEGGCSAAGTSESPWSAALWLGALVVVALRRRANAAVATAAIVAAATASLLSGCTSYCTGATSCDVIVESVSPPVASARGGDVIRLDGRGLEEVESVRVGDREADILTQTGERLSLRVPAGLAGAATITVVFAGGELPFDGLFAYEPIDLAFADASDRLSMPEPAIESRGVVAADFDRDGDLDAFVARRRAAPIVLENDGTGALRDAPDMLGTLPETLDGVGAAAADVDGDGDVDVVAPMYGGLPDLLLRNERGVLTPDPAALPVDASSDHVAALEDLDRDGDVDLVVAASAPDAAGAMLDRVLLNDGEGIFTELAGAIPARADRTTGLALGDVDGDGAVDLVTANDGAEDVAVRLLLGDGTGRFEDAPEGALPVQTERARTPVLGDLDGDGDLDLVAASVGQDRLYLNDGEGRFTDATIVTMPIDAATAMDAALADLDLDGDLDLAIANSGLSERVYLNAGDARMIDASLALPYDDTPSRGLAVADFDRDGALDLLVSEGPETPSRLLLASEAIDAASTSGDAAAGAAGGDPLVGSCAASPGRSSAGAPWLLLALAAVVARFRRRVRAIALALPLALAPIALGCDDTADVHMHEEEVDGPVGMSVAGLRLSALSAGCSTAGTEGISAQLIDEMLCLSEGRLVRYSHRNVVLTSSRVHPYLSPEGRDRLYRAADRGTIRINSGLRTIAEQYVLYRGCSVAATPGRSNHETGRAIDVGNYGTVNSILINAGFSHPLPSSDPVHYEAPGADLRNLSVLAFQRLWNANNPGDRIAEDGVTGPETLSRLAASPAEGFRIGRVCGACTPRDEVCNGEDDDCDGTVDDGVKNACGMCGPVPEEICNSADDDCDGEVDEGACDRAEIAWTSAIPADIEVGQPILIEARFRNAGGSSWTATEHTIVATAEGAEVAITGAIAGEVAIGAEVPVAIELTATAEGALTFEIGIARGDRLIPDSLRGTIEARPAVGRPPAADAGTSATSADSAADARPPPAMLTGGCSTSAAAGSVGDGWGVLSFFVVWMALGGRLARRRRRRASLVLLLTGCWARSSLRGVGDGSGCSRRAARP